MEKRHIDPWTFTSDKQKERSFALNAAADLDPLIEKIADARYVLLGEASHGTHEYYTWRSALSRRLIEEKGFNFIAVEGDWPDCYRLNRYIKGYNDAGTDIVQVLNKFERWPTWMWGNWEIAALAEWLRNHNAHKAYDKKTGFYGLDVYSLWESLEMLVKYLDNVDPESARAAREAFDCFQAYGNEGMDYARGISKWIDSCRDEVVDLLRKVRDHATGYNHDPEASLNMEQNAFITVNAEHYYRSMVLFDDRSWNVRDRHMTDTLYRLMQYHGTDAKCIVWEHNTHIGDARATTMIHNNMINVGQLLREEKEDAGIFVVGFGSYEGSVLASPKWGEPMQVMEMPPAREGSIENILHKESPQDRYLLFNTNGGDERFDQVFPHRAIGVVYHPEHDSYGNYVNSNMAARYDAFIYLDQTTALHPLRIGTDVKQMPETYPFGH